MTQVEKLREVKDKNGWEWAFLDMDDFLLHTSNTVWRPAFWYFAMKIAGESREKIGVQQVKRRVWEVNDDEFMRSEMGLHPSKYARIAKQVVREFEIEEKKALMWMKDARAMMYLGLPRVMAGTRKAIDALKEVGMKNAIVSNSPYARLEWVWKSLGIDDEALLVACSTRKRKDWRTWKEALDKAGVDGDRVVMGGDSWHGDILAAGEAGIKARVWKKPVWKINDTSEDTGGALVITVISQLIPTLISHFG